jgi:hypothetical protein
MQIEIERDARRLLGLAGFGTEDTPGPVLIAHGLCLGVIEVPAGTIGGDGEVQENTVLVREGLSPGAFAWTIAHEIWEHHTATSRRRFRHFIDKEVWCDAGAAALLAPRLAFEADARRMGPAFVELGASYGISATAAALRYGEVTGAPVAVVAPLTVRTRGLPCYWPAAPVLRRTAAEPALPRGVRRSRLAGQRVALVAA